MSARDYAEKVFAECERYMDTHTTEELLDREKELGVDKLLYSYRHCSQFTMGNEFVLNHYAAE